MLFIGNTWTIVTVRFAVRLGWNCSGVSHFGMVKIRQSPYTLANMGYANQRNFAKRVVQRLREAGYDALWAGGCVRDMLRGVRPKDYDVATSARPEEVKRLFRRTLMVGAKFGVVVVLGPRTQVEVATFRCDVGYEDGRRPRKVVYTDAKQDALRRDFTINGMFYDPVEDKTIDYVGGKKDLKTKIVRAIGQPSLRFAEDHLRMLRAVRFTCTLGFKIEAKTAKAIRSQAQKIERISVERIAEELLGILQSPSRAEGIRLAGQLGLLQVILPEVNYVEAAERLEKLGRANSLAGLACLLYDSTEDVEPNQAGKRAGSICRRLKLGNHLVRQTDWLVAAARLLLVEYSGGREISLAELKRMMASGSFGELLLLYRSVAPQRAYRQLRGRSDKIDPKTVRPEPLITGRDLLDMGVRPGPRLGGCLAAAYEAQLNELVKTKTQARKFAGDWLSQP